MIKPIWAAVGGLALLGTAGGIGVLVATTGGEDEVTFQPQATLAPATVAPSPVIDTPSPGPPEAPEYPLIVPSFAPVATCLPSVSAPGTKTWR